MVYNYTKPRGPIAAMYSSPGPCYGLPGLIGQPQHDPRSPHRKAPAYSFGVRHGKMRDDCSPGPAYLPERKIYRDGRDGTPHYSLYGRKYYSAKHKTPGPGAYNSSQPTEKSALSSFYRPPSYSFGIRHRTRRTDDTPGPNNYTLDNMLGKTIRGDKKQAPNFTMRSKTVVGSFTEDLAKTPGPGAYHTTRPDVNKDKSPAYSLTSRNNMPGDSTQKPGPGAHSPEKVYYSTKKSAPQFSFGIRHSQYSAPLIVDCVD